MFHLIFLLLYLPQLSFKKVFSLTFTPFNLTSLHWFIDLPFRVPLPPFCGPRLFFIVLHFSSIIAFPPPCLFFFRSPFLPISFSYSLFLFHHRFHHPHLNSSPYCHTPISHRSHTQYSWHYGLSHANVVSINKNNNK